MSGNCTKLYIVGIFYNVPEDKVFEFRIPITQLDIDFHNEDYRSVNDIKKIRCKGIITSTEQGNILLGCL